MSKTFIPSAQQKSIIEHDGNIIVSAGAGCGKTTTMIERIMRLIKDGVPIENMLIVTFTRAAAAEIRAKLGKRLIEESDDPTGVCRAAADAMPISNIGTLHSYCQKLIHTYFYAAGLDPSATVCDAAEASAIENESIVAAVREAKSLDPVFASVCAALSNRRNDLGTVRAVRRLVDFALSMPEPREFLSNIRADAEYFAELDGIGAAALAAVKDKADALKSYALQNELAIYIDAADALIAYARCEPGSEASGVPSRKRDPIVLYANSLYSELKKKCEKCRELTENIAAAKAVDSKPYAEALARVALDAIARFDAKKAELGKLDYSDLEHGARRILKDEGCLNEISRRISHVFIDEYQDVNPLQSEIAECFRSAGATMFLVGDVKQSIYAFRRCDPKYFKLALEDAGYTRFDLTENRRSAPDIIDFVNDIFSAAMTGELGDGVEYRGGHSLVARAEEKGAAEFVLVDPDARVIGEDGEVIASAATEREVYSVKEASERADIDPEAVYVVHRVMDLLDHAEEYGISSPGDIAILLRSVSGRFCDRLVRLFAKMNIRVSLGGKSDLKAFPEAKALLDIARCVDDGFDDIALYTALRSSLGGFSDAELLEIASDGERNARFNRVTPKRERSYAFYQKVANYTGRLDARLAAFKEKRDKFALYFKCHDAASALGYLTSEIGYFDYVYGVYGNKGAAAVEALISVAASKRLDMHAFLAYCDNEEFELETESGGDAVVISTIHAAKGLEYDYCIVADGAHGFNERDGVSRVIIDESRVALKVPDTSRKKLLPSAPWLVASAKTAERVRKEELRLFYVALTRAKKRLIVVAKSGKNRTEPTAAACMRDFMTVPAERIDEVYLPSAVDRTEFYAPVNQDIVRAVRARCEFRYPVSDAPIKTCVTKLAHSGDDYTAAANVLTDDDFEPPYFDEEIFESKTLSQAFEVDENAANDDERTRLRGTAYHRIMELIDFAEPNFDAAASVTDNAELVDRAEILAAARKMKELTENAQFVARERYFIVDMPVPGGNGSELVQGVIDLLIVDENGNATVLDYKTTAKSRLLCDEYRLQLDMYARAVEKCTPYKVVRKCLYSFKHGLVEIRD